MRPTGETTIGQISHISGNVAGTGVPLAIRLTFSSRPSNRSGAVATVTGRVELFAFQHGQAETFLTVQTGGPAYSAQAERRLAELLVERARRAIG